MASASKQITEPFLSQVERVREEMRAKFLRTHQILQQREAALTSELDQLVANYRVEKIKEQMQDLDRMKDALKSTVQCEENKEIVEKSVVLMKKRRKELEVSLETLLDEMWGVELDWEEELEGRLLEIGEIKVIAAPALIHEKERITGSTYADELDMKIRGDPPSCMTHGPNTSAKKQELVNVLTREPEEIIMVLLDTSGSMLEVYFDGKSKFTSVIEAFTEFSDLSRAYNFKHVIGLTYIRHIPKLKFPLSENFYEFVNHFTNLEAEGRTSIYDAIYYAINCLNTFKFRNSIAKYANRRIICLTDGEDNRSRVEPNEVVELLIKNNIIMDTVLLCKEKVFSHFIAKASGGYSFQPKSSKDLMQIFGQEPMLTMAIRKSKKPQISAQKCESINLKKLKLGFDTKPEHRVPDKLKEKAILPELYLAQAFMQKQLGQKPHRGAIKRIFQELVHYQKNPHPYFEVFPMENDIAFWHILINSPEETPYSQGVFHLYIEFTKDYPDLPPHIRFVTPIYHCNINSAGRICHSIIDRSYTKGVRVRDIFDQLFGLLMCPDDSDPLDSVKAIEHHDFPDLYFQNAQDYTEEMANKHLRPDILAKIVQDHSVGVMSKYAHLMCPLTKRLFNDPVLTKHGKTYEREAILQHLEISKYDPFSFQKLTEDDLMDNIAVKEMAAQMNSQLQEFGELAN